MLNSKEITSTNRMYQNHMTRSAGAVAMGECKNMASLLGDGPLKSPAMSILQEQFDGLQWRCS